MHEIFSGLDQEMKMKFMELFLEKRATCISIESGLCGCIHF